MSRRLFGALGSSLSDADLARALTVIGSGMYQLAPPLTLDSLLARDNNTFILHESLSQPAVLEIRVGVVRLDSYVRELKERVRSNVPSAAELLNMWRQAVGSRETPVRICLDLAYRYDSSSAIDLAWLAQLFGAEGLNTVGVYVAWQPVPLTLEWNWPLRIGVPSAELGSPLLRAQIERSAYAHLFDVVDLDTRDAECDLLLLPLTLRDAVSAAGALGSVRASAVVVVGGLDAEWPEPDAWLYSLRNELRAGAVAVANVPEAERGIWFETLVAAISHNTTLDQALYAASRGSERDHHRSAFPKLKQPRRDLLPPLVFGDREFLDQARMLHLALRIGRAATETPGADAPVEFFQHFSSLSLPRCTVADAGKALADVSEHLLFDQELTDATALVEFRTRVAAATGNVLDLPPIEVGPRFKAARPPALPPDRVRGRPLPPPERTMEARVPRMVRAEPPAPRPERFVLVELQRSAANGEWERNPVVVPAQPHAIDVFIGEKRDTAVSAPTRFDESLLPPSASGHQLRVVFTPLWRSTKGELSPPQTAAIHLPPTGDSRRARFFFTAPSRLADLRGRIVVLHRNRVLETLIVDAVEGKAGAGLRLNPENKVSQDFGQETVTPDFDAALVINDNPQGVTGITAISGDSATFFEPEGIKVIIADIRKDLASLNAPGDDTEEVIKGLDDDRVKKLLYALAMRGAGLAKVLKAVPQLGSLMADGKKLQVIDAVSGAYFPVEFVYDGKAPAPTATRCENAVAALGDLDVHKNCPNRKDENYICPAAFWGFSRCIERQPPRGQPGYQFSQPKAGATTLRPLRQALLAASKKVRPKDLGSPDGVEAVLAQATAGVARAGNWADWKAHVGTDRPSLLVLLPHSLESLNVAHLPSLEIDGDALESVRLDEDYVRPSMENQPIVLLLGCSTTLPDIPFLSFVQEFKGAGAALVVGTLATIRGRQTVDFVRELLAGLKAAAADGGTFDETFLKVKQRMLAAGDPFVLSLIAYGDTGWRVQP